MSNEENLDNSKKNASTTISGLSHDGRGLATIDQKTAFVAGALPDETVTYCISRKHKTYIEADTLQVLIPSNDRVQPPCEHFGLCGGCSLQHMGMATQLALKQQTLIEQLRHFGNVIPETILPPLTAASLGYRHKARLGVKFVIKKNKLLVGFREKASRYLADLNHCAVLHPAIGTRFEALRTVIASLSQYQHIPQVEVAIGDTDVALVFRHLEPLPPPDINTLIAFGQTAGFHIYLQPNKPDPIHKIWPTDGCERLTYSLPDESLTFLFHPLDFTQINLAMNRLMVAQAISLLDLNPDETALDLYCGIGNFTLPMAKRAKHVIGIEGSTEMVGRAMENARHNTIDNVMFHAANLEAPTASAPWVTSTYDKLLLDPPRVGAKAILPLLPTLGAKRIVYVSCNPATLARDAGEIVHHHKYQLKSVGIMNMFPHTAHIEAMAVFELDKARRNKKCNRIKTDYPSSTGSLAEDSQATKSTSQKT